MSHWPGTWIEGAYLQDPSPLDRDNDGFEDIELETSIGPLMIAQIPWYLI